MKKILSILGLILICYAAHGQKKDSVVIQTIPDTISSDSPVVAMPADTAVSDTLDDTYVSDTSNFNSTWANTYGEYSRGESYVHAFVPGIGATFYKPKMKDSMGTFRGISIEYTIISTVNDKAFGHSPSHFRFYGKLNILQSDKKDVSDIFGYAFGFDVSFEHHPNRHFLIPYYGLEFGGMMQKFFNKAVQLTPLGGVHLIYTKNLVVNASAGYVYPFADFDMLQGFYAQTSLSFILW